MLAKVFIISQGLLYIPFFNEVSSANLCERVVTLFLFKIRELLIAECLLHKVNSD